MRPRTIRAILAEVHVRHNPVMRPVLHSLINYSASQLADASTYLSQSPWCQDSPPDANHGVVAAILQWAHQGIPIFDYNYVKVILRKATRQALSSRYMTMEGLWMLRDPYLIALFLDKWSCSQERSLVVRLR
jgi:hypothetical protein